MSSRTPQPGAHYPGGVSEAHTKVINIENYSVTSRLHMDLRLLVQVI